MFQKGNVVLEALKSSNREFLAKDKDGITVGRIFLIDINKESKYCLFKLSFYKNNSDNYFYLSNMLEITLSMFFRNLEMNKVSIIINENISLDAFLDLGFKIEGVIDKSAYIYNKKASTVILGIDTEQYNNNYTHKFISLRGANINLKILSPQYAQQLLNYYLRNKQYLKPYEPLRENDFYTLEFQRKSLIESYKNYLNNTEFNFGIFKGEEFIGKIRLSSIIYGVFNSGFLGYSIDEKMQNKGYMKEAVGLIMNYAYDKIKLHRIEASTLVDNIKSQKVLKACGFKEIGISKKYLFINEKWRDHIIFYKLMQ